MKEELNYKILIVEDDKFFVKAFRNKLENEGFKVSVALNGEEGILKLVDEKPDIILLDLLMPIKDGFEFLTEKNLNVGFKEIPVIVLSVLEQSEDIDRALELGAVDYIVKGDCNINEVVKKVKEHLAKDKIKKDR